MNEKQLSREKIAWTVAFIGGGPIGHFSGTAIYRYPRL